MNGINVYPSLVKNLNSDRKWLRDEAERAVKTLNTDAYVKDGVLYWKSNDRVPFDDMIELAVHIGLPVDVVKSRKTRDEITAAFLAEYRKNYKGPTDEERFEARAAHGPGVELVNIVTGHKWRT